MLLRLEMIPIWINRNSSSFSVVLVLEEVSQSQWRICQLIPSIRIFRIHVTVILFTTRRFQNSSRVCNKSEPPSAPPSFPPSLPSATTLAGLHLLSMIANTAANSCECQSDLWVNGLSAAQIPHLPILQHRLRYFWRSLWIHLPAINPTCVDLFPAMPRFVVEIRASFRNQLPMLSSRWMSLNRRITLTMVVNVVLIIRLICDSI